jgi:D-glycero-alpha-D-manno-heptose-7-phosphate kinase
MTTGPAGAEPVLRMARAPMRVSLAGGGTDLPSYATRHGAAVLSVAIDRYVAVTVFPRAFDGAIRASWEEVERVADIDGMRNQFAAAALRRAGIRSAAQFASHTDVPSGTGLGSSGAFTVALLHALRGSASGVDLAEEASVIEMHDLDRPVGKHDQYIAALGGLRLLHIDRDLRVRPEELALRPDVRGYLERRLLLFYTGFSRDAGQVLTAQDRMTRFGDEGTLSVLDAIGGIVPHMREAVTTGRVDDIGPLLHEHWTAKARLSRGVSTDRIDRLYKAAREAGADGGKLLGAGGGGFLLVSAAAGRTGELRAAMAGQGTTELPFGIDTGGSRVAELPL